MVFLNTENKQVMNTCLPKHDSSIHYRGLALQQSSQLGPIILAMLEIKGLARNISHFAFGNDFCTSFINMTTMFYTIQRGSESPCHRAIMRDE